MARFTQLPVSLVATSLLLGGALTGLVAAESNRYGIPDYPDSSLTAPKAPVAPVVAPRVAPVVAPVTTRPKLTTVEPAPPANPPKETTDEKSAGVSGFFRRMFTFKRGSSAKPAVESPPVSQAPQLEAQVKAQPKNQKVAVKPVAPISKPAQVLAQTQVSPKPASASSPSTSTAPTDAPTAEPAPAVVDEAPDPLAAAAAAEPEPASMKPQLVEETPPPPPVKKPSTLKSWSNRLRWSNFVPVQYGTVPALVAGALPEMRTEAPRGRAPNLPRQSRLDVDQRIERLGPDLEPVVNSEPIRGVNFVGSTPAVMGSEDPVISLETLAVLQSKQVSDSSKTKSDKSAPHSEEIKLIPYENKRGEQFRLVSLFFDPPPPKVSKATTPSSSATYEQK
ncbi:MAG: hypothetical protein WCG63_02570 [Opitutaceae bacterium]